MCLKDLRVTFRSLFVVFLKIAEDTKVNDWNPNPSNEFCIDPITVINKE